MRRFSCFFVFLLIVQLNLVFSDLEDPRVYDIYVDNKVETSGKGGIHDPYSELSEGLKKALDLSVSAAKINIWIAPSADSYHCEDYQYYFLGEDRLTLRIRMWKDQPSCREESYCFESPVITFEGSILNFDDMVSIEMSNLHLYNKYGAIIIDRGALSLENITFTSVERVKGALIYSMNARALNVSNLVVKMEVMSPMLTFALNKDNSAKVSMKNIQVHLGCFEDDTALDSPVFKFFHLEAENSLDIINIEDFWIRSLDAALGIDAQAVLAISGFRAVSIKKFYLENTQVNATGTTSFVSLSANQLVQISGLSLQRNRFVARTTDALFSLESLGTLEIVDSCFSGNQLFQGSESDPLVIINPDAIASVRIANFRVSENIFDGHLNIFEFSEFGRLIGTFRSDIKVSNITISENTNLKSTNQFSFVLAENSQFTEMTLENVDYRLNSLSGRVFALGFPLNFPKGLSTGGPVILLKNIQIKWNINAVDTNFLYFIPSQKDISTWVCEPIQEPYKLFIEGLVLTDNNFSKGSNLLWFSEVGLFQIQYSLMRLENILIANNTFGSYSVVMIDQRTSSFSMNSSEVSNNSFEQSHLINSNYVSSGIPCNFDAKAQGGTKILYRYGIVIDSNFTNLSLNSGALIKANHGFFILQSANFSNITLRNSKLASMAFSLFRLPPNSPGYREDADTSNILFNGWSGWSVFFQNALKKRTSEDCIYLYSVEQNTFENITLNSATLISLTGYGFNKSNINFESNSFRNISLRAGSTTPLVYFESVDRLQFVKNRFNKIEGNLQILSMPQSQSSSLLAFENNDFVNLKVSSLVSYSGERLKTVSFSDNQILFSEFSQIVIGLNSKISSDDWIFEKMDLYHVGMTVNSSNSQVERYAVFLLFAANTTNETSQIKFTDCVFENIWIIPASKKDLPIESNLISVGSVQRLSFKNVEVIATQIQTSGNLLYIINSPVMAIENSSFRNVSIKSQTGMISTFAFQISIRGSSFRSIQNTFTHGVLCLSPSAHNYSVQIEDSLFLGISTQKGAVFSSQPSISLQYGSVATKPDNNYVLSLQVSNCNIRSIANDNSFFIFGGKLLNSSISDVQVTSSFQTATPSAIFSSALVSGELDVRGLSLDSRYQVGNFMFELIGGNLSITLRDFVYDAGLANFLLTRMNAGGLSVRDSEIRNVEGTLSIVKATFSEDPQYSGSNSGASAMISFKNTTFKSISFKNSSETFIESFYSDLVSNAPDVRSKVIAVIRAGIPIWLSIENCTFEDIVSMPAILISQTPGLTSNQKNRPRINIFDSKFQRATFVSGPALTILPNIYNPIVTIEKTLFESNSAVIGGALAIYDCTLNISQTIFRNNSALKTGAAVLLGEYATDLSDLTKNTFENNNAASFGSVVSEALDFNMSFMPDERSGIESAGSIQGGLSTLVLRNVTNHEFQRGFIKLDFLNARGESAPDLSSSRRFSFTLPISSKNKEGRSSFGVSCQWNQDFSSCQIPMKGMTIVGDAGDLMVLNFQYVSSKSTQNRSIILHIRPCLLGEYNTSLVCEPCTGQTYTVNPNVACTHCPANAVCQSQARICPVSGYWNADIHSAKVLPCYDNKDGRCQRGPDDCGGCKTGFTGPLCWGCDLANGYVESGYLECSQCQDASRSLVLAILVGSGYLICQLFFVYIFFTGASLQDDVSAIEFRKVERCFYVKSLLTYLQLMSILCLTNQQIYGYFGLASQVGNLGSLISYGTQCAMVGLNLSRENFIYYQTYLIVAAPWIQFIFTAIVVVVASLFKRGLSIGKVVTAALIYLIFFMQPGLVTNLTLFLSCKKLDGMKYHFIASHPYWSCDSEIYESVSHLLALPNLLLWALIIPLVIFLILKKNKANLQNDKYEGSLGVLMFDLKKKYYFWGVAQMIFKVILAVLVYGLEVEIEVQIFSFLLLLWIYQSLVRVTKPFSRPHFNKFETILMNLLIFNIIVAKYLIDPINGPWISQTSFTVSVLINTSFILYIVWKVLMSTFFAKIQQTVEDQIDLLPNTSSSGLTDKLLENDSQQEEGD